MRVFHDLNDLPEFKNAVVTIGSFDGVHHGHQQILDKVKNLASKNNGESIVITFHPHPRLVIYPKDNTLRLITTIEEKIALLKRFGIDNVVVVPFTFEFSRQSADEYIQKFLIAHFQPKHIVIGYDHRFGLNRQGDINYLKWHAQKSGFEVFEIEKQEIQDITVSSTKIRNALEIGAVGKASELLNHYYTLTGKVVRGKQVGTKIGFPTANLEISNQHKLIPPNGIYAAYVIHKKQRYGAMLYIGDRPSLNDGNKRTIEVNIFDFNKNLYGDKLIIEMVDFIREDEKFENLEALKNKLQEDRLASEKILETVKEKYSQKENQHFPSVAVVILNYSTKEQLGRFLPTVLKTDYPNMEVIVADNGSTDGSIEYLENDFETIKVLDLKENHGFAKGYNLALKDISSEYIVLLNSDVEVTEDWIAPIIELMESDPTIGAVQPKIKSFDQKNSFEYAGAAGGWIDSLGYPFCRGRIFSHVEKDKGQYDRSQQIFWASGAAMFVRTKLFLPLGGFDADYFAHMEEIDFCWRLKRAGYKVVACPESTVYHVGGGTLDYQSSFKTYLNFRNNYFTILKNFPKKKLYWLIPLRISMDFFAGILFLLEGKFTHLGALIKALRVFLGNYKKFSKKRAFYNDLIEKVGIGTKENEEGMLKGSIVLNYYLKGKKKFKDLRIG